LVIFKGPTQVYADVPDNFVIQKENIILKSGGIIGQGGFGKILKKQLKIVSMQLKKAEKVVVQNLYAVHNQ